jgi:CTP synthase (UTP-ammonia lyase)
VRNVLGVEDADHEESSPEAEAERLVVTALSCSLVGQQGAISLVPGSRSAALYGRAEVVEDYLCNYGVNPEYAAALEAGGLRVTGRSADGEVRIVELPDHPFFLATLFIPQVRSTPEAPHPLVTGFVAAAGAQRPAASTKAL